MFCQYFSVMIKEQNPNSVLFENKENHSIRLKITQKCPWECIFCHKEGGWDIDDMRWDDAMRKNISLLKENLKLEEAHLTGGEPTSSRYIEELAEGLISLGLDVKLTSNGQFSEKKLNGLIEKGIKEFNFSIHALNSEDFIKMQKKKNLSWANNCIENQKNIITKAQELGARIKLNVVIGGEEDIEKALQIFDFAKNLRIPLKFLSDLFKKEISMQTIEKIAIEILGGEKFKETIEKGGSNKSSYYRDKDGFEFGVKSIRENKLKSLCSDCNEKCLEQFYGIRLEQREGRFYVRLCIDRKDGKNLMLVEDFLESEYFKEINKTINE